MHRKRSRNLRHSKPFDTLCEKNFALGQKTTCKSTLAALLAFGWCCLTRSHPLAGKFFSCLENLHASIFLCQNLHLQ